MGDFPRQFDMRAASPEHHAYRIQLRLMRIVKWALYSTIYLIYLLLVGLIFVQGGWQWGLLALFLVLCVHPLRYLWDDADKALHDLQQHDEYDPEVSAPVEAYQKKIALALRGGLYFFDTGFVVMTYLVLRSIPWGLGALFGLISVELLHQLIRRQNSKMRDLERKSSDLLQKLVDEEDRRRAESKSVPDDLDATAPEEIG